MSDTPLPEHFTEFQDWLEAVRKVRGLSKSDLARAIKVPRQRVNKWYHGTEPSVEVLKRIAIWAGLEYVALSLLVDKQPQPGSHRARLESAKRRSPQVERIAQRLDQLADDEEFLTVIEDLAENQMRRRVQLRRRPMP